jgi:hypothetical protein
MLKAAGILAAIAMAGCGQVFYQLAAEDPEKLIGQASEDLGSTYRVELIDELWVVGSNVDDQHRSRAIETLRDYSKGLTGVYFDRFPNRPVRVYLFRDKETYQQYCNRAYENPPKTPFGFYMPGERKIVVNLSTGHGTLAHELVHPLMEADFPRAPAWFNEGFASLFEASRYVPGQKVEGMVNWRLRSLKRAFLKPSPPTLAQMLALHRDDFYGANSGVNYAIARYLCMYLQEKNLLVRFYREFRDRLREDSSGALILQEVTGRTLAQLEADYRAWVATLSEE